jgi:hypothetical protein
VAGRCPRSCPCPFTGWASFGFRNLDFEFCSKSCIFKADGQVVSKIGPALRIGPFRSARARAKSEEIFENIAESREDILKASEARETRSLQPFMSIKVVKLSLVRIPQDFVGLSRLFEPLFCFFVSRIVVRVVFEGYFSVGPLYLFFA